MSGGSSRNDGDATGDGMSLHFITFCRVCGIVVAQCRCPSKEKAVSYITCDKCLPKEPVK